MCARAMPAIWRGAGDGRPALGSSAATILVLPAPWTDPLARSLPGASAVSVRALRALPAKPRSANQPLSPGLRTAHWRRFAKCPPD